MNEKPLQVVNNAMEDVIHAQRTVESLEAMGLGTHEAAMALDRLLEALFWLNFLRARIPGGDKYYNYGGE